MKDQVRKGATRTVDIPRDVLHALSRGELECATLAECLAVDQAVLARTLFPALTAHTLNTIDEACQLGVLKHQSTWVRDIWAQWLQSSQAAATHRICQRALRNLK